MPIDYRDYPPNWRSEIRPAILARAGHKCEYCGAPNGETIERLTPGGWWRRWTADGWTRPNGAGGEWVGHELPTFRRGCRLLMRDVTVVLTIAHLPESAGTHDDRPEMLRALCQYCHLTLDGKLHGARAALTRKRKRGLQPALLEVHGQ